MQCRRMGLVCFFCLAVSAITFAQNPVGNIQQAHGGVGRILQADTYRVQGSLTREGQTVGFILEVDGESSRFEAGSQLVVRQEALVQYRKDADSWSRRQTGWEGLREIYILPIVSLQHLPARYQFEGSRTDRDDFSQKIQRKTGLAHRRKTPRADLAFDRQSNLLSEALFTTVEQNQSTVEIQYFDYQDFSGLTLPTRVERTAGDTEPWIFQIESIDFAPNFGPGHFDFQ